MPSRFVGGPAWKLRRTWLAGWSCVASMACGLMNDSDDVPWPLPHRVASVSRKGTLVPRQVRLVEGHDVPLSQIGHALAALAAEGVLDRRKRRRGAAARRRPQCHRERSRSLRGTFVDASADVGRRADSNCAHWSCPPKSQRRPTRACGPTTSPPARSRARHKSRPFEPGRKSTRSVQLGTRFLLYRRLATPLMHLNVGRKLSAGVQKALNRTRRCSLAAAVSSSSARRGTLGRSSNARRWPTRPRSQASS